MMGLLRPLRFGFLCRVFSLSLFLAMVPEGLGDVFVKLTETPPAVSGNTTAAFSYKAYADVRGNCPCSNYSFNCKLDDGIFARCEEGRTSYFGLGEGNHTFEVCTNGSQGVDYASYNWTIDTTPPTVYVTASESFTSALNVSVVITFSEPVPGGGGFSCPSVDACDLRVYGPGQVIPSSLKVLEPNLKYSLLVNISSGVQYGRLILVADENFCSDSAGNLLTTTQNSSFFVHFGTSTMPQNSSSRSSVPIISRVVSTFATVTLLATASASGLLTVSTAVLQSAGAFAGPISQPSSNLCRMVSHVQVFALSRWLGVVLPVEYYELSRRLEWTIPYMTLPWEAKNPQPATVPSSSSKLRTPIADSRINGPIFHPGAPARPGSPLSPREYELLIKVSNNIKPGPVYTRDQRFRSGWIDFKRSMFWLVVIGGSLIILHLLLLLILKLKKRTPDNNNMNNSNSNNIYGALTFPRFELFLLVLAQPCISQASAALVRGQTSSGVKLGIFLLVFVVVCLLAWLVFISGGIIFRKLFKYEDAPREGQRSQWYGELTRATLGPGRRGQWTWKSNSNSAYLMMVGPLFEDLRGPPKDKPSQIPDEGLQKGDQVIASEEGNEDAEPTFTEKLFGTLGIYYPLLECAKRVCMGVIAGASMGKKPRKTPSVTLLCITLFQLIFIVLTKPFINKNVQLVEIISAAAEVGMLATCVFLSKKESPKEDESGVGIVMVVLFLLGLIPQMLNQWLAQRSQVRRFSPQDKSFFSGLKVASHGLLGVIQPTSRTPDLESKPSSKQHEGEEDGEGVESTQVEAKGQGRDDWREEKEKREKEEMMEKAGGGVDGGMRLEGREEAERVHEKGEEAQGGEKAGGAEDLGEGHVVERVPEEEENDGGGGENLGGGEEAKSGIEEGDEAGRVLKGGEEAREKEESGGGEGRKVVEVERGEGVGQGLEGGEAARMMHREGVVVEGGESTLVGARQSRGRGGRKRGNGQMRVGQERMLGGRGREGIETSLNGEDETQSRLEEGEKDGEGDEGQMLEGVDEIEGGEEHKGGVEARGVEELEGGENLGGSDELIEEEDLRQGYEVEGEPGEEDKVWRVGEKAIGEEDTQQGEENGHGEEVRKELGGGGEAGKVLKEGGKTEPVESTMLEGRPWQDRGGRERGMNQRRVGQQMRLNEQGREETAIRLKGEEKAQSRLERGEEVKGGEKVGRVLEGVEDAEGGEELGGGEKVEGGREEIDMVYEGVEESEEGKEPGGGDEVERVLEAGEEAEGREKLRGSDDVVRGHTKMMPKEGGEVGGGDEVERMHGGGENVERVLVEEENIRGGESIQVWTQQLQGVGGRKSGKEHRAGGKKMSSEAGRKVESRGGLKVGLALEGGKKAKVVLEGVGETEGGEDVRRVLKRVDEVEVGKELGGIEDTERVLKEVTKHEEGKEPEGGYDAEGGQEAIRISKGGDELGGGDDSRRMIIGGNEAGMMLGRGESSQVEAQWLHGIGGLMRGKEHMRGGNERRLEGRRTNESRGGEIAGMELAGGNDAIWMPKRGDEDRGGEGNDMWLKGEEEVEIVTQGGDAGSGGEEWRGGDVIKKVFEGGEEIRRALEGAEEDRGGWENKKEPQGSEEVKGRESIRVRRRGRGGQMIANEERKIGNERSPKVGGEENAGIGGERGNVVGRVPRGGGYTQIGARRWMGKGGRGRGKNEMSPDVGGGEDTGRGLEGGTEAERGLVGENRVEVVGEGEVGVGDEVGEGEGAKEGEKAETLLEGEEVGMVLGGEEVEEGGGVRIVIGGEEAERGLGGADEEKDVVPKESRP